MYSTTLGEEKAIFHWIELTEENVATAEDEDCEKTTAMDELDDATAEETEES
jgi:hypothetical protein